jgi:hypothetical protein
VYSRVLGLYGNFLLHQKQLSSEYLAIILFLLAQLY